MFGLDQLEESKEPHDHPQRPEIGKIMALLQKTWDYIATSNSDFDLRTREIEADSQTLQKMASRNPSPALKTTIEDNDREISLIKARIDHNEKTFAALIKTLEEHIELADQQIQRIQQPAPLLAPAPVPAPAQTRAPAKKSVFTHRLGAINGADYASKQDL
jgi:hypothetical protein